LEEPGRGDELLGNRKRFAETITNIGQYIKMILEGDVGHLLKLFEFVVRKVASQRKAAARRRLEEWQEFAEAEVKKGGWAIFRDIKAVSPGGDGDEVVLEGGWPVVGDMALAKLETVWHTIWAKHSGKAPYGGMAKQTEGLESIAIEKWLKVWRSYPDSVGLGADVLNPKAVLVAGPEFASRMLDRAMAYVAGPRAGGILCGVVCLPGEGVGRWAALWPHPGIAEGMVQGGPVDRQAVGGRARRHILLGRLGQSLWRPTPGTVASSAALLLRPREVPGWSPCSFGAGRSGAAEARG
jgi:hypothetical protein